MTTGAFQSAVNVKLGFGVIGELIVDGPQRAEPLILDSTGGTIGNFFTKDNSTGVATQGGTIGGAVVAAGFLVNPKEFASFGGASPLSPTLTLAGNKQGVFLTMGTIVVSVTGAANIGDLVQYSTTTGALSAVAPVASFTASQSTTVLTVSAITAGVIGVGTVVTSAGVVIGTVISRGTGTGGTGTYNLNTSATVNSAAMTAPTVTGATGSALVPNCVIYRYPTSATGLIAVRITN